MNTKSQYAINELSFSRTGKGEPFVIIRGMSRSKKYWPEFDQSIAKWFDVISPDNRGIGETRASAWFTDTIYDYALDYIDLLDDLDIEKAHFAGNSLGGMIGLAIGIKYPERCHSLTVMNSSIGGNFYPRMQPEAGLKLAASSWSKSRISSTFNQILTGGNLSKEDFTRLSKKWDALILDEGFPFFTTIAQTLAAFRFKPLKMLQKIEIPTLLLYGEKDQFVPNYNSHIIHKNIPGSMLKSIDGGGHEMMAEYPEKIASVIRDFTNQVRK
ncbi:MAG: hypothetical protein CMP10_06560 [Zetaproteobacteria bacterium]|nr:hypothetical protein [Pseudobdellovibrionaceae bacterium]